MIPSQLLPYANHLWQSTLFAVIAGVLTLLLRRNRAQIRYCLWLSASLKFLIPFSILVAAGGLVGRHSGAAMAPSKLHFSSVVEQVEEPFTAPVETFAMPAVHSYTRGLVEVVLVVWVIGFSALLCRWSMQWRRLHLSVRNASLLEMPIGLPVKTSPVFWEPGVFGIFRPTLLLPDGIVDCLTPQVLEAMVAHELCHVRRRDNLVTAIHMAVEAIFWFHPLVWWLGARLLEERERACDEEVLLAGNDPHVYAEGILKVCDLYLASPLACVAGVTGGDLRRRIEAIVSNRLALRLNYAKKAMLVSAGALAFATPVVLGMLNATAIHAQSPQASPQPAAPVTQRFEVASVKPCKEFAPAGRGGGPGPVGRLDLNCQTVVNLIRTAYILYGEGNSVRTNPNIPLIPIEGGPAWVNSDHYAIEAKAEDGASSDTMHGPMLRALLEDRFQLRIRRATREVPVYEMAVAKGGPHLHPFVEGSCLPMELAVRMAEPYDKPICKITGGGIRRPKGPEIMGEYHGLTLDEFAQALTMKEKDGLPVINKTGIAGTFDFEFTYARKGENGEITGPTILEALQDQLGLKLVPAKGPGQVLVIDHVERPSEN